MIVAATSAAVAQPVVMNASQASPTEMIHRWRLALAADLLRDPDATLAAVGRRVGCSGHFALSTAFKRARR